MIYLLYKKIQVTGHVCVNSDEISKIGAEQRGKIVIYSRETERGA